jgi:hypothetical protein
MATLELTVHQNRRTRQGKCGLGDVMAWTGTDGLGKLLALSGGICRLKQLKTFAPLMQGQDW